ncbi:hypothetical protein RUND412_008526 [Rhizina undulata]
MPDKMDLSFDDMVQRKRAETIANETLGKNRHVVPTGPAKMNSKGGVGKRPAPGSGVNGRNTTTGPNGRWMHDLHHKNNPNASRVSKLPTTLPPQVARSLQGNRLYAALHGDSINVLPTPPSGPKSQSINIRGVSSASHIQNGVSSAGISIKGSAGPFVVQASNFAKGTTAEDIKMAMNKFGKILSCILLSAQPTVICELVFEKKDAAERCIQQFNNQVADGRILHIQFKPGPPVSRVSLRPHHPHAHTSLRPPQTPEEHAAQREEADRVRRAAISFQDGSYGVRPPPLYSDALVQRGRGFNR